MTTKKPSNSTSPTSNEAALQDGLNFEQAIADLRLTKQGVLEIPMELPVPPGMEGSCLRLRQLMRKDRLTDAEKVEVNETINALLDHKVAKTLQLLQEQQPEGTPPFTRMERAAVKDGLLALVYLGFKAARQRKETLRPLFEIEDNLLPK
jgi:hypothetical protein